ESLEYFGDILHVTTMFDRKEISGALLGENGHRIVPLTLLLVALGLLLYKSLVDKNSKHYPNGKKIDSMDFSLCILTSHRTTSFAIVGQLTSGPVIASISAVRDLQYSLRIDPY